MNALDFIHRFVPAQEPASGRTLLVLHGTGGNENDLLELGRAIDPHAALLSPRGKVLENGAPRFFRRLAEGVFDEKEVAQRAGELADFVEKAIAVYPVDPAQLLAVGYSNGANIASAMLLLGIAPFRLAILLRPMVPLSPPEKSHLKSARVLLSAGEFDPIARPEAVKELAGLYRSAGAEVTTEFLAAGHELTPLDVARARKWLQAGEPG
jgi:phospholipase/carboxylesterase